MKPVNRVAFVVVLLCCLPILACQPPLSRGRATWTWIARVQVVGNEVEQRYGRNDFYLPASVKAEIKRKLLSLGPCWTCDVSKPDAPYWEMENGIRVDNQRIVYMAEYHYTFAGKYIYHSE